MVQEAGYAMLAPLFGLPAEMGLAVSLLKRAREIVLGVPALVIVEFAAANRGVGYFIMSSANVLDTTITMAGIVLVVVPTILAATLLQAIEAQVGD